MLQIVLLDNASNPELAKLRLLQNPLHKEMHKERKFMRLSDGNLYDFPINPEVQGVLRVYLMPGHIWTVSFVAKTRRNLRPCVVGQQQK